MTIKNHFRVARTVIDLFYNKVSIGRYKLGLYSLIAITPGIGDVISVILSIYILWIAAQIQMPMRARVLMCWNIILDLSFGSIPIAGDIADTVFRAHVRNITILGKYIVNQPVDVEGTPAHVALDK